MRPRRNAVVLSQPLPLLSRRRSVTGGATFAVLRLLAVGTSLGIVGGAIGCDATGVVEPEPPPPYIFELPPGFPAPRVPTENPMSDAKVELGRHLFYDERLSGNATTSCATCHQQEFSFTDELGVAEGSTGEFHTLGSMSLANAGYASTLGWGNPILRILEDQTLIPMFGDAPIELGLTGNEDEVLERFRAESVYDDLFAAAFPDFDPTTSPAGDDIVNINHIVMAISSFERIMISGRSPYDRFIQGGEALDGLADFGREIFFSERADCFHCHGGVLFSDSITHEGTVFDESPFHNNGLYNLDAIGSYPANQGVYGVSGEESDRGLFKAPSLRNIAVTAPYMHDGSLETLGEVLDHYARGGTRITDGPNAGDGRDHPNKSGFVHGFVMAPEEKFALLAFLETLTDDAFLSDPRFSNPWP